MATVLFVGRFQPLHKGHVRVIRNLLKRFSKIIIAIGSIQEKRTEENPFSFRERKRMLELVFGKEIKNGKIEIIGVRDENSDEKWSKKLLKRCKFDVVATGNEWVERCFEDKKPVLKIKLWRRELYSSTRIRKLMKKRDEKWKKLVPREIAGYLKKLSSFL